MDVTFTMSSVGFSFVPFEVRPIGREDANVHERSTLQNEHDSMHLLPAGIKKKRTLEMRGVRVKDEADLNLPPASCVCAIPGLRIQSIQLLLLIYTRYTHVCPAARAQPRN